MKDRQHNALRFVHEIIMDELREGWDGHGGVMLSLEAIVREGLGLPPSTDEELIDPRSKQQRQVLAEGLANCHTLLLVAGCKDDELLARLKAARDSARNLEAEKEAESEKAGLNRELRKQTETES